MKSIDEVISRYSARDTATKKSWYSSAAKNYRDARPAYPAKVISTVVSSVGLGRASSMIEIGSGPGTVTKDFAKIGCTIDAVEPNPDFIAFAHEALKNYTNVCFHQSTFEDYQHHQGPVDAVIAATSFHWVDPKIAFEKSARLLRDDGFLVLLWNKELQPDRELADQRKAHLVEFHWSQ